MFMDLFAFVDMIIIALSGLVTNDDRITYDSLVA